jgi:hypothetical protein
MATTTGPVLRASMVFKAGDNGWTESWFIPGSDPTAVLPSWIANCPIRAKLLGTYAAIVGQRLAVEPANGVVETRSLIFPGSAVAAPDSVRDTSWNAVVCLCRGSVGTRRNMWIRGVPDDAIYYDEVTGLEVQSATIANGLAAWVAVAVKAGQQFLIRCRAKVVIPPPPAAPPAGVFVMGGLTLAAGYTDRYVVSVPNHTYVLGQTITTRKARRAGLPWLGGIFVVLNPLNVGTPTATFEIVVKGRVTSSVTDYEGGMYWIPISYVYDPIQSINYTRYASKRPGKILFVSPGRRRRR